MEELYFCEERDIEETLKNALSPHICGKYTIIRGDFGKPYVDGNPVFFSIAHRCGVDFEVIKKRKTSAVFKRLSAREKEEIQGDYIKFLQNWVAKESYIKYLGGTISWIKRLEYAGGALYFDGKKTDCVIKVKTYLDRAVYAVCTKEIK